ncbi:MAG: hypothetical protein GJ676_19270 [Rhodobacteraceae bacterium]|nr:hypothetical protein [Paracoccaceae bacterium]
MFASEAGTTTIEAGVLDILRHERTRALSTREWKFRLGAHGLAIKDVKGKQVVTSLPKGVELGVLPAGIA